MEKLERHIFADDIAVIDKEETLFAQLLAIGLTEILEELLIERHVCKRDNFEKAREVTKRERVRVCVCERERVCVCVCERERERENSPTLPHTLFFYVISSTIRASDLTTLRTCINT